VAQVKIYGLASHIILAVALSFLSYGSSADSCLSTNPDSGYPSDITVDLPNNIDDPHFYFISDYRDYIVFIPQDTVASKIPDQRLSSVASRIPISEHTDIFEGAVVNGKPRDVDKIWGTIPGLIAEGPVAIYDLRVGRFYEKLRIREYQRKWSGGFLVCVLELHGEWTVLFQREQWTH
jgi:hypothetical protein